MRPHDRREGGGEGRAAGRTPRWRASCRGRRHELARPRPRAAATAARAISGSRIGEDGGAEAAAGEGAGGGGQEGVRDGRPGAQQPGLDERPGGEVRGEAGQRDRADEQHGEREAGGAEEAGWPARRRRRGRAARTGCRRCRPGASRPR